ncbi:MAG: putative O-glycosylation ligase, exosortase A system-associated [Proteobacteria bacterium]|nr:putative O-glycosylation ligase, exosortase A system-associated [Pseudomonadota bacterium]
MRDLLLVLILLWALPKAVKHTYVAVNLWSWISLMNPHRLSYGFAFDMPFAAIAAAAALISLAVTKDTLAIPKERPVIFLALFITWMFVTTATAIYPEDSIVQLKKVLKIQIMTVVALAALHERRHIQLFLWINVLSIGFFGLKGGFFTVLTGGGARVWGPPGSFIEDNNELGTALIMTIPLMNYLRLVSPQKWVKRGLLTLTLLSAAAALGTQSRGALLAIAAMGFVLWLRSERKALTGISIALVGTLLISFMPSTWESRMSTIQDYQNDGSAMGRINAWHLAVNIANHRLTGAGFEAYTPETFAWYAPNPVDIHVAHSIYFSVLAEHGYIGLFLFLGVWMSSLGIASRIRKETRHDPELLWLFHLAGMCQVSLIGYAVGGAFLSLAYFDLPYNIMVILVTSWRWLKTHQKEAESKELAGRAQIA